MEYKAQYQEYLLQATAALDAASARFLPEESEVCRAARYSLLGGGKRIRAILTLSVCDMLGGEMQVAAQFAAAVEMLHCYSLIMMICLAWTTMICAGDVPLAIRPSASPRQCWPVTCC